MEYQNQARIKEIVSWYPALTPPQGENFLKLLNYGRIGGSGKFVILPVDQGFEHGPGRSFESNPAMYDPVNQAKLAIAAGCNAYAAPLGSLEAVAGVIEEAGIPTILKVNSHDLMMPDDADPYPAITSWVEDAVRLGCAAVGFTIYSGSSYARAMYEEVEELVYDARTAGLVVVIWAYPRGSGIVPANPEIPKKDLEVSVDVVAYGVQIACLLGAHIVKCKAPKPIVGMKDSVKREVYTNVPTATVSDCVRLIMRAAFNGHRVVINSGGEARETEAILEEVRQLNAGGSFGSIVGRNAFQRPHDEAVQLLHKIQDIYGEERLAA